MRLLSFASVLITCLCATPAVAQNAVMTKDSIACWSRQDFAALALGEYRMNYWGSHQQKRDFMAQGRCFALRKGETITVEQLVKGRYAALARVRRSDQRKSFWTDRGFQPSALARSD